MVAHKDLESKETNMFPILTESADLSHGNENRISENQSEQNIQKPVADLSNSNRN